MDDRTARAVNWLADGRSAALVAPAIRLATNPGARDAVERVRGARDLVADLDVERMRRVATRLGEDREFRRGVQLAATRMQQAVEASSRPKRRFLMPLLVIGAAVAAVFAAMKLMKRNEADSPLVHEGVPYPTSSSTASV
jgi:hypothetical protein